MIERIMDATFPYVVIFCVIGIFAVHIAVYGLCRRIGDEILKKRGLH
ncbi:MAG: hypothetical protein FWG63_08220 [Defluviitaleaceae bacterium]|nr:hypothetical protein [Defluviitaleaceae bacterium]